MKTIAAVVLSLSFYINIPAQECSDQLSMFNESAKAEIYDDAMPRYTYLVENCPKQDIALYIRADKMFGDMLKSENEQQNLEALAKSKIQNLKLRLEHFPEKSPIGLVYPAIGKTMYDNNIGSIEEQFEYFEEAWLKDSENFKSPKEIYIYFMLYNSLEDKGQIELNDLFAKYDALINHIESMKDDQARLSNKLLAKIEMGERLTMKEHSMYNNTSIYLKNYDKIIKGMNKIVSGKTSCENIIPIYTQEFENQKTNKKWLQIATARVNAEDCTSDPLFIELIDALNDLDPSSKTLKYLGKLALKNDDFNNAQQFFTQALDLEEELSEKARLYFYLAESHKGQNSLKEAFLNYNKALELKPSMGVAYLRIASMIESGANSCGKDAFEKRAVYWKAENYARRAASVDAGIKSNALKAAERYKQLAPSKQDIFTSERQGETISFDCWIGGSVKVPSIEKSS